LAAGAWHDLARRRADAGPTMASRWDVSVWSGGSPSWHRCAVASTSVGCPRWPGGEGWMAQAALQISARRSAPSPNCRLNPRLGQPGRERP